MQNRNIALGFILVVLLVLWTNIYEYIPSSSDRVLFRVNRLTHTTYVTNHAGSDGDKVWIEVLEKEKKIAAPAESAQAAPAAAANTAPPAEVKFSGAYDIVGNPVYLYRDIEEDKPVEKPPQHQQQHK